MKQDDEIVDCRIVRETDAAILLRIDEDEIWIPLSQVNEIVYGINTADPDLPDQVVMTHWIAAKKGLC